ncbi:MAG: hypothetical protein IJ158_09670 [Treponema sp.]|nr:hypothetical protein [Treponema sp.]
MKKMLLFASLSFLITLALIFAQKKTARSPTNIDLTRMNQQMMYSTLVNMLSEPDSYNGKTVRLHGQFLSYEYEENGKTLRSFMCMISDPQACCAQGMEFTLNEDRAYPDDYPTEYAEITIRGIFKHHSKNGYDTSELVETEIESM